MSLNIAGFIRRLIPTLSRSDSEVEMDISVQELQQSIQVWKDLASVYASAKWTHKESLSTVQHFYKELPEVPGVKLGSQKSFASDVSLLLGNCLINAEVIRKLLADISNEVIVSQALTAARANVLRAVGHYFFIARYAMDLANRLYILESEQAGVQLTKDATLNNKQIHFVRDQLWIFCRMLAAYGQDPVKFQQAMDGLSMVQLPQEAFDEASGWAEAHKVDFISNLPDNFIGSPIYTVRLIIAQWQADRYRHMKDKKKLLELRALYLRALQEQGRADVQMEKELAYLQKRVTDLDYKIAKIEESVQ